MSVKPLVATPCYANMLCVNYVTSIIRLRTACSQIGMPLEFYFRQDSLITRARNDCAAYFLAGDYTHLFFIDADIGFEPKAALRLLQSGHDVVAGVYHKRAEGAGFTVDPADVGPVDENGFARTSEAPTGFMCIARRALELIARMRPDLRCMSDGGVQHRFFDPMVEPGTARYLSEDYAFCRLWGEAGGEVHIDARSDLTHQGTRLYTGSFYDALQERAK